MPSQNPIATPGVVLVLGVTSQIVKATAASLAQRGKSLVLGGRDPEELSAIASDLSLRYRVPVSTVHFDAGAFDDHAACIERVLKAAQTTHGDGSGLEGIVVGFGYLGEQAKAQTDWTEAHRIITANYTGAASILTHAANHLEARKAGFICVLGSVAGDRGRQSNYVYGSAKGAIGLFVQGLRNRLFASGVRVLTVKPGFVDTKMTYGKPGLFLVASPVTVGSRIARAIIDGDDVLYVPWFWQWIMLIIRLVPERLFKKLKL